MQKFETELNYLDLDVKDECLYNEHVEEHFVTEILQSKYKKVLVNKVVAIKNFNLRSEIETLKYVTKISISF